MKETEYELKIIELAKFMKAQWIKGAVAAELYNKILRLLETQQKELISKKQTI